MAVLVTAIHVFLVREKGVDARDKPAHDGMIQFDRNPLQERARADVTPTLPHADSISTH
ncbi:MAG TPA: hypothetical protein VGH49_20915 [Xanthobacteraceae bacterium]|jgi:hypothetical protein